MSTEQQLKEQIIKSAEIVKRKVKQMRNFEIDSNNAIETMLKPITEPLRNIAAKNDLIQNSQEFRHTAKRVKRNNSEAGSTNFHESMKSEKDNFNQFDNCELNSEHSEIDDNTEDQNESSSESSIDKDESGYSFKSLESDGCNWSLSSEAFCDVPYGAWLDRGKLKIGNMRLNVMPDKFLIAGSTYDKTRGLHELLFKKIPNLKVITENDLEKYKQILTETNAHRRNFSPKKPIKSNKGSKYLNIIRPLFKHDKVHTSTESLVQGSGLSFMKQVKPNVDFVYWDDPNELVERLKLLIASRDAGNTGLDNDIISIIEELHESGYIKSDYLKYK